jgi:hypothetical protein
MYKSEATVYFCCLHKDKSSSGSEAFTDVGRAIILLTQSTKWQEESAVKPLSQLTAVLNKLTDS